MTASDHKKYYSRFLSQHEGRLHFAAHSHHFWPDVTRAAHLEYWDDCARLSDEKWGKIFGDVIPKAQKHVARMLNLKHPEQIVFAPNTHELSVRILSVFTGKASLRVLTTTSEFHSWKRQISRLQEVPSFEVESIDTSDFFNRREEILSQIKHSLSKKPELFFISQVFFDSGLALTDDELKGLVDATSEETIVVIDGYHGFAALPCDLSGLEGRIFYLGGGYKYAQAGEGVGFLVVPKGDWRPAYTGWFAEFGELSRPAGKSVGYTADGMAFMGATQDPSGLYRFNAAWDFLWEKKLSMFDIHSFVQSLQKAFIARLPESFWRSHKLTPLYSPELNWHGHFLALEASSEAFAKSFEDTLKSRKILIDRRGKRLRFGFGLYQNHKDVEALAQILQELPRL